MIYKNNIFIVALFIVWLSAPKSNFASEIGGSVSSVSVKAAAFKKGSDVVFTYAHYDKEIEGDKSIEVFDGRNEFGNYFYDGLAVILSLHATAFRGSRDDVSVDTEAVGGACMLRWHFVNQSRFSIYLDYGYGILMAHESFPPAGTKFNFSRQYGLGLTVKIRDWVHGVFGFRQLHISNGKGIVPNNPSFDGAGGYIGYIFIL